MLARQCCRSGKAGRLSWERSGPAHGLPNETGRVRALLEDRSGCSRLCVTQDPRSANKFVSRREMASINVSRQPGAVAAMTS